jgi:hypothetical protein
LRIGDVYPGSEFFLPESWVKKMPDPEYASKKVGIFTRKTGSKLLEI